MRSILNFNSSWNFFKATADITAKEGAELVNLPHSWNALDGQDGGNDYYRGSCVYKKSFSKADLPGIHVKVTPSQELSDALIRMSKEKGED